MWPTGTWLEIWPDVWPLYEEAAEIIRTIAYLQELYKKTEYYSIDNVVIETDLYSDIINMSHDVVDLLFEDTSIATNVKNLITSSFVSGSLVNNDISVIQTFATDLNTLLNG